MGWFVVTVRRAVLDTKLVEASTEDEAVQKATDPDRGGAERLSYVTGETIGAAVEGGPFSSPEEAREWTNKVDRGEIDVLASSSSLA